MNERRRQEREKDHLNNKIEESNLHIDRGFELLLRNQNRRIKPKTFQIKLGNSITLFGREFSFNIDLGFDIKNKS